ncbi:MAG TPA: RICIN domain-containing protein [Candidatus Limnocylindrales bacterium]
MAVSLIAGLTLGLPPVGVAAADPAGPSDRSVPVTPAGGGAAARPVRDYPVVTGSGRVVLPDAVTVEVAATGVPASVGGLPVAVSNVAEVDEDVLSSARLRGGAVGGLSSVRVSTAQAKVAEAAGLRGVVLSLSRVDGAAAARSVRVSVSYGQFAAMFGADFGDRLQLVGLPACALATPQVPRCQSQTLLGSLNVPHEVSAQVRLPGGGAGATVLAVTSGPVSDGNSFKQTSLSPAYSWAAGGQGGSFSWSYPLTVPVSLGGPAPDLKLSYDSGSVDAQTLASNGQASWVGEGWDLQAGYVERSYRPCPQDYVPPAPPGPATGDLCWFSPHNATLVFGGRSYKLIRHSDGVWHTDDDNGLRVELLSDVSLGNGDNDGEYWRVTTLDGTQYWFGRHRRPGDAAGVTNSVQTVPVYADDAGEPCHNANYADAWCQQGYRWNLDWVTDTRGNSMTYFYTEFAGNYGRNNNNGVAAYDVSATLDHIDYGTRAGAESASAAPMQVWFAKANRCVGGCVKPGDYLDTPWDLHCELGSCPNVTSPTFFSPFRLASVYTQIRNAAGTGYRRVDQWDLTHTYPSTTDQHPKDGKDDTTPNLWLDTLTHTGFAEDGLASQAEPPITFHPTPMFNRVDWGPLSGTKPYTHQRIDWIDNGVGNKTLITYSGIECINGVAKAAPGFNPSRCFPVRHQPEGAPAGWDWFNKYVVTEVREKENDSGPGRSPDEVWTYTYGVESSTDPSLWAHDFNETVVLDFRSWPLWRGYSDVTTTHGPAGGPQTVSKSVLHRGLDGDSLADPINDSMSWEARRANLTTPIGIPGQTGGIGGVGGKCLDAAGFGTANGTPIQLYSCTGEKNQQWRYDMGGSSPFLHSLKNPDSGRCLDLVGLGSGNGTGVQLWDCTGAWNQRWIFLASGSLYNPGSGRCLDILNASTTADGAAVKLWDCNLQANQVWRARADGSLVNPQAARCIDVADAGTANGSRIQDWMCHPGSAQQWTYSPTGSSLRNPNSGKCLDVLNSATVNGSQVQLFTCNDSAAQIWVPQADGTLRNPNSGRCLDAGAEPYASRQLFIWDCNGGLPQRWAHQIVDATALAGRTREEFVTDGPSTVLGSTIHNYQVTQTGLRPKPVVGGQDLKSYMVRETNTKTRTFIHATGGWRWTETQTGYDSYGLPTESDNLGDMAISSDDTCTDIHYNRNPGLHLIDPRRQVTTTSCQAGDANVLSSEHYLYDGNTTDTAPSQGLLTKTEVLASISGGAETWKQASRASYDTNGRITAAFDALDRQTTSAYTPASGAPVTSVAVTGPMGAGWTVTTTLDPGHGNVKTVTDVNGKVTAGQYDALGRLTKVWRNNRATSQTPDQQYTYTLANRSWVHAQTLGPNGNQISSFQIFDARMRPRQTQTVTEDGKRAITDVQYDGRGLEAKKAAFYNTDSGPTSTLVSFADADLGSQTRHVYDNLARIRFDQLFANNTLQWQTETRYEGDRTGVIPPAGGTLTQDLVDARGRTVEKRQYSGSPFTGAFTATSYTHDRLDRLTGVKDPANNQWTYEYDLRGRKTKTIDPDAGTSTSTYDDAGQVLSTTDARGQTLHVDYDTLGRKTKQRDSTPTGTVLAEWVYDTVDKGQLFESIRYVGSDAYKTRVTDLDDGYRPLHTEVEIPNPAVNGALAATYAWDHTYKPNGAPATTTLPGVGGLPAETLATTYDNNGFSQTLSGTWAGGGSQTYIFNTDYTFDGLVSATMLGNAGKWVRQINEYQMHTRRLSATHVEVETTPGTLTRKFTTDYDYDPAGNITLVAGKTDGIADQTECFRYDHLRRLTEAWSQPSPGNGCLTPQRTGADPYWRQWTFDAIGNRLTQTDKDPGAGDTTWTYTVGSAAGVKPHQVKTVTAAGPKADTPTRTFGYDLAGNTTSAVTTTGVAQTLSWDKEGHLAAVTEPVGTHSYLYDADGRRLITRTPTTTTLYLPDGTELELPSAGGAALGKRYYGGTAVRDAAGVKWTCTNHQNTSLVQIDSVTLTTNRRRSMPYGEDRTTTPAGWVGTKGYVGGTKDDSGLVHLSAREYDPTLGRFISVDPIMILADPQQWNAYVYAGNNPTTWSDPSGLARPYDGGDNTVSHASVPPPPPPPPPGTKTETKRYPGFTKVTITTKGEDRGKICFDDHICGYGMGGSDIYNHHALIAEYDRLKATWKHEDSLLGHLYLMHLACGNTGQCNIPWANDVHFLYLQLIDELEPDTWWQKSGESLANTLSILTPLALGRYRANRMSCHSFDPDTPVLLADGTTKKIKNIKVGDRVLATDPQTGHTTAKEVTQLHVNDDWDLAEVNILDEETGLTTSLETTWHHPFWNTTDDHWTEAADLTPGTRLRDDKGKETQQVISVRIWTGLRQMRDLTVDDIHTYYVLAGSTPILVHNAGGDDLPAVARIPSMQGLTQTEADNLLGKHGFELKSISNSGAWATYQHGDGSKVSIELGNGRIVRTSTVDAGPNAKNYPQRWNPDGTPTSLHTTGETLCP